jgi:hypothetical protein
MPLKLKEAKPTELSNPQDRASAKLARIARCDVNFGAARALVLANRLERMRSNIQPHRIVGDAYANNNGNAHEFLAYHCPECDTVVLGRTSAINHCNNNDND